MTTVEPKQITLKRDHQRDLRFTGTELAAVSGWRHNATRWEELALYRTVPGRTVSGEIPANFILARHGVTQWENEKDEYWAAVLDSEAEVIERLIKTHPDYQLSDLAKELLAAAGIEQAEEI